MDSHDRYVLAIAMLDGDRDARKILADLLEEQGERGLAQWARQGSNKRWQRIDFAIMLLPTRRAILAGAAFLETAYSVREGIELAKGCTLAVNRWCCGELGNITILSDLHGRVRRTFGRSPVPFVQASRRIFDAVRLTRGSGRSHQMRLEAEEHGRHDAGDLRHIGKHSQALHPPSDSQLQSFASANTDWQIDYLKQAFQHLISPAEHRWPL
jgi:hypothetical protein